MLEKAGVLFQWWLEGRRLSGCPRETWQARRERALRDHLDWVARHSPFYRGLGGHPLDAWPRSDKSSWMAEFDAINTAGLSRSECEEVALRAERERDFRPTIPSGHGEITVGLSSGTSGARGLFVASRAERTLWAGVLLRRILPDLLGRPHRVGLVLRSDSRLYQTLGGGSVQFRHHDLHLPWKELESGLLDQDPTLLAAPPSVLDLLARSGAAGRFRSLRRILSVAEVLDPAAEARIRAAFGLGVEQIYQATEGLLASPCAQGKLHLHEEHLLVEKEWMDAERTRYRPVITDFRRRVQPVIRYRLNDVLVPGSCSCGRHAGVVARVEGRCDERIRLAGPHGEVVLFPDFVRRLVLEALPDCPEWRFVQESQGRFRLELPSLDPGEARLEVFREAWSALCRSRGADPGEIHGGAWVAPEPGAKLRRVVGLPET